MKYKFFAIPALIGFNSIYRQHVSKYCSLSNTVARF
jgi:hypothetical protein